MIAFQSSLGSAQSKHGATCFSASNDRPARASDLSAGRPSQRIGMVIRGITSLSNRKAYPSLRVGLAYTGTTAIASTSNSAPSRASLEICTAVLAGGADVLTNVLRTSK